MTLSSALLLATSTAVFVSAASSAKAWALSANSIAWLALTLALYMLGNLIMLRLIWPAPTGWSGFSLNA